MVLFSTYIRGSLVLILPAMISLSSIAPIWLAETQAHAAHWE